jgi:hypothetical protein
MRSHVHIGRSFCDSQVQHRKMLVEIEHPKIGEIKQLEREEFI